MLAEAGAAGPSCPVVEEDDAVHTAATVERLAEVWGVFARPSGATTTCSSSARGPRASPRPCTGPRTGSRRPSPRPTCPGGQAGYTSMIENFFGFLEGIGGAELARLAGRQAERFGAELLILNGVVRGHLKADAMPVLELASGDRSAPTS